MKPRLYQELIFNTATLHNTLVVLPTGLGKTLIAKLLIKQRLEQYPNSKAIFLAPTKPLVQQHYKTFKDSDLSEEEIVCFTGSVSPEKRREQFKKARLIFSTPQGLENDLLSNRIKLHDISLIVFDEAHRAVGDYSYVYIAKNHNKHSKYPRILALTASPGSNKEKITEVCKNLYIEEIEVRQETDKDVAPYVQEMDSQWIEVEFPKELKEVQEPLKKCYLSKLEQVYTWGFMNVAPSSATKTTLLKLQGELHGQLSRGNKEFELLKSISLIAEAMKVQHALELIETQGVYALKNYVEQLQHQARTTKTKATQNLVSDINFKTAVFKMQTLIEKEKEHPKLKELKKIILKERFADKNSKIIIFNQYRDQAVKIESSLRSLNIDSKIFVGQAKKRNTGLSQKEQKIMLEEFSNGEFPVLIATSVAEEGLDIPKVDLVIFYEPIPSAIRTVQRRGRTGRLEKGRVIFLITKGTRDVSYRWVAHHKEKRMYRAITEVKKNFKLEKKEKTLDDFTEQKGIGVVVDHREKGSQVLKSLIELGVNIDLQQLSVGDYLASDRVCIEYKRVPDFVSSIIDGRLLEQLRKMRQYSRAVIIIEGEEDIYSIRKIHPNAIRGMLSTIAVSYNIPIIFTKTSYETAALIHTIARREQEGGKDFVYHTGKPQTEAEQLVFTIASIPGLGTQLAKPLLEHFRTIEKLVGASLDELQEVPLIGKKKASMIYEFLRKEYDYE